MSDTTYALVIGHYYNGYQFNPKRGGYESDGGCHVFAPTDVVIFTYDLSDHDVFPRVLGEPHVLLVTDPHGRNRKTEEVPNAVLHDGIISVQLRDPPVGSEIRCDWKWTTEQRRPLARATSSAKAVPGDSAARAVRGDSAVRIADSP
jgi:hypothetical protein